MKRKIDNVTKRKIDNTAIKSLRLNGDQNQYANELLYGISASHQFDMDKEILEYAIKYYVKYHSERSLEFLTEVIKKLSKAVSPYTTEIADYFIEEALPKLHVPELLNVEKENKESKESIEKVEILPEAKVNGFPQQQPNDLYSQINRLLEVSYLDIDDPFALKKYQKQLQALLLTLQITFDPPVLETIESRKRKSPAVRRPNENPNGLIESVENLRSQIRKYLLFTNKKPKVKQVEGLFTGLVDFKNEQSTQAARWREKYTVFLTARTTFSSQANAYEKTKNITGFNSFMETLLVKVDKLLEPYNSPELQTKDREVVRKLVAQAKLDQTETNTGFGLSSFFKPTQIQISPSTKALCVFLDDQQSAPQAQLAF